MLKGVIAFAMMVAPCLSSAATLRVDVTGALESAHLTGVFNPGSPGFSNLTISRDENSQYFDALNDGGAAGFTVDTDHPTGNTFFSDCYGFLSGMCGGDLSLASFDASGDAYAGTHGDVANRLDIDLLSPGGVGQFNVSSDPYLLSSALPLGSGGSFDFDGVIYGSSRSAAAAQDFAGALLYFSGITHSRLEYNLSSYSVAVVPLPAALGSLLFALAGFGVIRAR